jgi:hypothetical protein
MSTSATGTGRSTADANAVVAVETSGSSTIVFHSPQVAQRPAHRGALPPHS